MRRIIHRLLNVFRGDRAGEDVDREVAAHLALLEEEHRRRGLTPDEAHLAARRAMGEPVDVYVTAAAGDDRCGFIPHVAST